MPAAVSPITRQTVGKTFMVAISLLGAMALAQVGVLGWVFVSKFRAAPPAETAETVPTPVEESTPREPERELIVADPFDGDDALTPLSSAGAPAAASGNPAPPKPVPVPQQQALSPASSPETTPQDRFNEMIEQGRTLRDRGDTYAAVTKLREAQVLEPKNPLPLAELAVTYERMGFAEKAAEQWRRVHDLGEAAGIYFAAADAKLKASQAQALREATVAAAPAPAGETGESVGLGPGSRLGFGDITRADEDGPGTLKKFTLRVPLKARARSRIDVRDVTIQVVFYDAVNNRTLEKTNAQVSTRWAAPPPDWSDDDIEVLEVGYTLPVPPQGEPIEDRKYYGYIASVYYKDALQDFRSDPPRLGQKAPPPRILPPELAQ
jgi:hypothetical protein